MIGSQSYKCHTTVFNNLSAINFLIEMLKVFCPSISQNHLYKIDRSFPHSFTFSLKVFQISINLICPTNGPITCFLVPFLVRVCVVNTHANVIKLSSICAPFLRHWRLPVGHGKLKYRCSPPERQNVLSPSQNLQLPVFCHFSGFHMFR